jgi:cell division protein FtsW (lipid II flippase)
MAAGIFIVFAFHTLVNLLMVVGMFPVVGVPLPFCSYGGSKMVLLFAMLGLLLNIRKSERKLAF